MTVPGSPAHESSLRERLVAAVGDRYVVEGELGRGGMAVVFAATDPRLKRAVAIKALPPELAFRPDVRSRFLREAQMAAALSHPNIVPIYAVDDTDGLVYMVMGRVRGESLAQKLHRVGRLPAAEARRVLRETADALAHAHAHGVIHRDIKPDNILLDDSGRVQVTDFGIARAMEGDARLTVTGVAVGTPTYMSPEQARGDADVDGRADIYALGVVGYQMLAGEPPFRAPNTPALLLKHVSEPPPPITSRRPDLPPTLAYVVDRALAKNRAERWRDAAEMSAALADNAELPRAPHVHEAQRDGTSRAGGAVWPAPMPLPPPYPKRRGGGAEESERYREAQRAWREKVRAQQEEWANGAQRRREESRASRRERRPQPPAQPLSKRLRGFQAHVVTTVLVMALLFFINVMSGGPPWFIFPWIGMGIGVLAHALGLWQDGARFRDFFRRPSQLAELERGASAGSERGRIAAPDPDARARELVSAEVLDGPHGAAVRRAADDERAVREILDSLAPADRAQLPDVKPTLQSLVDRVASLATALHRLDTDVRPGQIDQIEKRLAEARGLPENAPDRERRITLLERQKTSITELVERRATLATQLENAALVLQTMRLDLLRLRSSGIGNAASDVHGVTQEARALSNDIGRVLDAAAEVRRL